MDPSTAIVKAALGLVVAYLKRFASKNDREHERERVELALAWGAELKAAAPKIVEHLEGRVDDLESRIVRMLEDDQLARVYRNFTYEAAREAIDERRRMLAHAAAGLMDPDTPIERKARVERKLRELDPADVLVLQGVKLVAAGLDPRAVRAKVLFGQASGDALMASGCVRLEVLGGGAGVSATSGVTVTEVGEDVLSALRSYLATRRVPFVVPGREIGPDDRSEDEARAILQQLPGLDALVRAVVRRGGQVHRTYERPRPPQRPSGVLTMFVHDWRPLQGSLDALQTSCQSMGIRVLRATQPYKPEVGEPYDILRVDLSGPHDLLRHVADDCEAFWS